MEGWTLYYKWTAGNFTASGRLELEGRKLYCKWKVGNLIANGRLEIVLQVEDWKKLYCKWKAGSFTAREGWKLYCKWKALQSMHNLNPDAPLKLCAAFRASS